MGVRLYLVLAMAAGSQYVVRSRSMSRGKLVASKSIKVGTGTPNRRRNAISFYNCKPGMEAQRLWFEPSRAKLTDSAHIDLVVRGGRDRVLTLKAVRGSGTSGYTS